MDKRNSLGKMQVFEVRNLVVETPTTIGPNENMDELLVKINEDFKTRHVYVVDKADKLIGSVRMNSIVQYLFPMGSVMSSGLSTIGNMEINFFSHKVSDIMKRDPFFVKEDAALSSIARLFINEKINELPIVESDMTLIGQINVYEIIEAYKAISANTEE